MKVITLQRPFKSLTIHVFLMILTFLLIPIYISFIIIKTSYENYIRQELSDQIIKNIKRGEEDFYQAFQKMANISNVFTQDAKLLSILDDAESSYYERNRQFDDIVKTLLINNLFELDNVRITMFDRENRAYANWSLNFKDYRFVLDQDWVKESMVNMGHISWSLFAPSFVEREPGQFISLARSILYPTYTGDRLATLIISINQRELSSILSRYSTEADFLYICNRNTGEPVFAVDEVGAIGSEHIQDLMNDIGPEKRGSMIRELEGIRYLLNYDPLETPWTFKGRPLLALHFTNYQHITDGLSVLSRDINYGMVLFLFILIMIMIVIAYTIARPIRLLDDRVKHYVQTREIKQFNMHRSDEIGSLGKTITDMETRINDLFDKLRQESEVRERYHFQALRAQINPHFLFNTLNTIRWMALIRKADNIADAVSALVKMLEYSISGKRELVALGEELDMIRNYMYIQNYRYGEDYKVFIEIPEELGEYRIIKFILQPIVENAFLHAFKNVNEKKTIRIAGHLEEGCLKLYVRDNGAGVDARRVDEINEGLKRGDQKETAGIGLFNVHERIRVEYGEAFGLRFKSVTSEGTEVEYTLPLLSGEQQ